MSARIIEKNWERQLKKYICSLKEKGFLNGEEGNWSLMELGRQVGGQFYLRMKK